MRGELDFIAYSKTKESRGDRIWSDVACPWCYVGKRRFEAALAQFEHADDVQVVWRSFELEDQEAPAERGGDRAEHLAAKYGMSMEQARQAEQRMTETAAGDGLDFRFDVARGGNTFDAHRLRAPRPQARTPGCDEGASAAGLLQPG